MFSSHGRQISMQTLYIDSNIGNMTNQDFEFVILESALANIVNKFRYKDILFDNETRGTLPGAPPFFKCLNGSWDIRNSGITHRIISIDIIIY